MISPLRGSMCVQEHTWSRLCPRGNTTTEVREICRVWLQVVVRAASSSAILPLTPPVLALTSSEGFRAAP